MRKLLTTALLFICIPATAVMAADLVQDTKNVVNTRQMTYSDVRGALDCSSAIKAAWGDTYHMSNGVGVNNVEDWSACWSYALTGPEVVFHLSCPDPMLWQVTLTQEIADVDLIILETCEETECVYAIDAGAVYTLAPVSGEFYFVVDGYGGAVGTFGISFEELDPPPSACDDFMQAFPGVSGEVVPGGVYNISGDTCDSANHLSSLACAAYIEAGLDHFYEMYLDPGAAVNISVTYATADGALWIVDACDDFVDANCLAYVDAALGGEAEVLFYQNNTGDSQNVWLVVDSWGVGGCGAYTGTIDLNGGAVAIEEASWGALKALYR